MHTPTVLRRLDQERRIFRAFLLVLAERITMRALFTQHLGHVLVLPHPGFDQEPKPEGKVGVVWGIPARLEVDSTGAGQP